MVPGNLTKTTHRVSEALEVASHARINDEVTAFRMGNPQQKSSAQPPKRMPCESSTRWVTSPVPQFASTMTLNRLDTELG